jgi:predicted nucleic acid-binding protein
LNDILIDTNVLVYSYDQTDGARRTQAREVLRLVFGRNLGTLSVQVLGEFFVTVTRKIPSPLEPGRAVEAITNYFASIPVFDVTPSIALEAIRGATRYQIHYYDALIWATAKLNQIPAVLTEDAEHNRLLEGVRYINPFHPDFDRSALEAAT